MKFFNIICRCLQLLAEGMHVRDHAILPARFVRLQVECASALFAKWGQVDSVSVLLVLRCRRGCKPHEDTEVSDSTWQIALL